MDDKCGGEPTILPGLSRAVIQPGGGLATDLVVLPEYCSNFFRPKSCRLGIPIPVPAVGIPCDANPSFIHNGFIVVCLLRSIPDYGRFLPLRADGLRVA